MRAKPFTVVEGGVRLAVRVSPRGSKNAVEGLVTGADGKSALAVRLTAPPVEGAANEALIAFLAERLDLRKKDIAIRRGETGRLKILHLSGDATSLCERLAALIG